MAAKGERSVDLIDGLLDSIWPGGLRLRRLSQKVTLPLLTDLGIGQIRLVLPELCLGDRNRGFILFHDYLTRSWIDLCAELIFLHHAPSEPCRPVLDRQGAQDFYGAYAQE